MTALVRGTDHGRPRHLDSTLPQQRSFEPPESTHIHTMQRVLARTGTDRIPDLTDRFGPWLEPLVLIAFGLLLLWLTPSRAPNPDMVSYLSLSEYWAEGQWSLAFNGYWSPLLPILLVPLVWLDLPILAAAQVVLLLMAGVALALLQVLMRRLDVPARVGRVMALAAVPFVLFAGVGALGPDLLAGTLLLAFLIETVLPRTMNWQTGLRAGIWAGLAFLAKAYALPFVLTFLLILILFRAVFRQARRRLIVPLLTAAMCLAISLTWIVPVSLQAGSLVISTAASYNRNITAPGSLGNPYTWAGLIQPAHEHAIWGWENPAEMPNAQDRPILAALAAGPEPGRLARLIANGVDTLWVFSLIVGAAFAAAVVVTGRLTDLLGQWCRRRRLLVFHCPELELALAVAIYLGGLLLLVVNARYLLFPVLVVVALSTALWAGRSIAGYRAHALLALLAIATAAHSADALSDRIRHGNALAEVHAFLRSTDGGLVNRRIASVPARLPDIGAVCFDAACTYLGAPSLVGPEALAAQLDRHAIELLIVVGDPPLVLPDGTRVIAEASRLGPRQERYRVVALFPQE